MANLTFLGTGDYLASERYWNGFVIDARILVEPSPTALPHLRRCGLRAGDLDAILVSHFHADHTFGWPFLLLELMRSGRREPVHIVGPPETDAYLASMMDLAGVPGIQKAAHELLDIRYVDVDGSWQTAGPHRVRAVEVDHVPELRCFGFVLDVNGQQIGYSGDTTPCAGLDDLAASCEVLVLECNGDHPPPQSHMRVEDVEALRHRFPSPRFVLTHVGPGVDASHIARCVVAADFEVIVV